MKVLYQIELFNDPTYRMIKAIDGTAEGFPPMMRDFGLTTAARTTLLDSAGWPNDWPTGRCNIAV